MAGILATVLAPIIGNALDKAIPDKNARDRAQLEIASAVAALDTQVIAGQMELNKIEAQSASGFSAGWRPFLAWGCSVAFLYSTLVYPHLIWLAQMWALPTPPHLDDDILYTLLTALLGLAGIRGYEKTRGVASR